MNPQIGILIRLWLGDRFGSRTKSSTTLIATSK
jgi:hypothetical protein